MWRVRSELLLLATRRSSIKIWSQNVRWRMGPCRKPTWLPRAPSKLFRIRKEPDCPEEEAKLISTMFHNYKSNMKSLRAHFIEEYEKTHAQNMSPASQLEEDAELGRNLELNRIENVRVGKLREADEAYRLEQKREFLVKLEMERQHKLKMLQEKADELVKQVKEQSSSFITSEKLEKAIEYALDNPVNYNFAIDLDGNIYQENKLSVQ